MVHMRGRESEASKPRRDEERETKHKCALTPTNTTATHAPHTLATTPKRTGPRRGPRGQAENTFSKVSGLVIYYACRVTVVREHILVREHVLFSESRVTGGLIVENVYLFANDVTALKPRMCSLTRMRGLTIMCSLKRTFTCLRMM